MSLAHQIGTCLPATPDVLAAIADACPTAAQALLTHPGLPEPQRLRAATTATVDQAGHALSVLSPSPRHPASTRALLDKVAESATNGQRASAYNTAIADFVYAHERAAHIEELCSAELVKACPRVGSALVRIGSTRHWSPSEDQAFPHYMTNDDVLSLLTNAQRSHPDASAQLEQVGRLGSGDLQASHRALLRLAGPRSAAPTRSAPRSNPVASGAMPEERGSHAPHDLPNELELVARHVQTARCSAVCPLIDNMDTRSGGRRNYSTWVAVLATAALTCSPNEVHRPILANNLLVRGAVGEAGNWVRPFADRIGSALNRPDLATHFHRANASYRLRTRQVPAGVFVPDLTVVAAAVRGLTTAEAVNTWVVMLSLADTWSGSVPDLVATASAVAVAA